VIAWGLVAIGTVGVAVSYWGVWVIVACWATGLVWWAVAALLMSGPIAGAGALLAWRLKQKAAFVVGVAVASAWVLLQTLCFTVLGFRFGG